MSGGRKPENIHRGPEGGMLGRGGNRNVRGEREQRGGSLSVAGGARKGIGRTRLEEAGGTKVSEVRSVLKARSGGREESGQKGELKIVEVIRGGLEVRSEGGRDFRELNQEGRKRIVGSGARAG